MLELRGQETVTAFSMSMFLVGILATNHRDCGVFFVICGVCINIHTDTVIQCEGKSVFSELICICVSDLAMPFLWHGGKQNDLLPSF